MITNKEKSFLSAVVYMHDSEETIGGFLDQLASALEDNFEKYEIICVNDASEDRCAAIVREKKESLPDCVIRIVNMSFFQGLETAMNAGVDLAVGDFVFEFDTTAVDYGPALIMEVYNKSLEGYDIVAARNSKKRIESSFFYKVFNNASGSHNKLASESFRILSRRAINRIHSLNKTLPYRKALYYNSGLKTQTITYKPTSVLTYSHTKQEHKNRQEIALSSLVLFTDIAYKFSFGLAILMMIATIATGVYVLIVFLYGQPVSGFSSMMWVISGCFFGVFAILAIIIKYLSLLIDLVFKKQKYVVESIET